ncbi:MAG: heme exporter protein CcmB [Alphaproteobacteria bacterium]|nr:heme exporter protein CcmB [Alphaproteobacteria bacterium]
MKSVITLIKRDLSFFFLKKGSFFNIISMFLILTFLLSSLLSDINIASASTLLLVVHIITTTIFAHYIFQDDYQDSSLDQLRSSGNSSLSLVVAKLFSYWILNLSVLTIGIIVYLFIYNIHYKAFLFPTIVIIITSILSTSISTLVSMLTLSEGRGSLLNILIGTPMMLAFFLYSIFLINSNIEILGVFSFVSQLKILIGFCFIILPISVFACSHALSEIQCKS